MKNVLLILIITLTGSCQSTIDCYDCYIEQFPKEQRDVIVELHSTFHEFLITNYSKYSTTANQLRAYCKDLENNFDFKGETDTIKVKSVLEKYIKSGLKNEFRRSDGHINYDGLYFRAQKNCLEYDYSDSLVYYYLEAYEIAGDTSPGVFVRYIANEADNTSLDRKILQHQFIMEYFIPIMMKK